MSALNEKLEISSNGLMVKAWYRLPCAEIASLVSKKYQKIAKEAQVKGFRPGKVPMSMIKTRFQHHVLAELPQEVMNQALKDLIEAKGFHLAASAESHIDDPLKEDEDFCFQLHFECIPDVTAWTLPGLSYVEGEIGEAAIEEALSKDIQRDPLGRGVLIEDRIEAGHRISLAWMPSPSEQELVIHLDLGQESEAVQVAFVGMRYGLRVLWENIASQVQARLLELFGLETIVDENKSPIFIVAVRDPAQTLDVDLEREERRVKVTQDLTASMKRMTYRVNLKRLFEAFAASEELEVPKVYEDAILSQLERKEHSLETLLLTRFPIVYESPQAIRALVRVKLLAQKKANDQRMQPEQEDIQRFFDQYHQFALLITYGLPAEAQRFLVQQIVEESAMILLAQDCKTESVTLSMKEMQAILDE